MRKPAIVFATVLAVGGATAAPEGYFDLRPGVTLETGDTWIDGDKRYRLYGVQACLRGTFYTYKGAPRREGGFGDELVTYMRRPAKTTTSAVCAMTVEAVRRAAST